MDAIVHCVGVPYDRFALHPQEQQDPVLAAHDPNGLRTLVLVLPDFYGPGVEASMVRAVFDAARTSKTANVVEMHYLWTTPVLLDDAKLHGVLGAIRTTSYAEGIRQSLTS